MLTLTGMPFPMSHLLSVVLQEESIDEVNFLGRLHRRAIDSGRPSSEKRLLIDTDYSLLVPKEKAANVSATVQIVGWRVDLSYARFQSDIGDISLIPHDGGMAFMASAVFPQSIALAASERPVDRYIGKTIFGKNRVLIQSMTTGENGTLIKLKAMPRVMKAWPEPLPSGV